MDNFAAPGELVEFTAPTGGVVSGLGYKIGSLVVIAAATVAETLKFEGLTKGVVDGVKPDTETWTEGLKIYWNNSTKKFTSTASGNTLVGVAVRAAALLLVITTDALAADLLITGNLVQVLDFAQLATDDAVVTVTINGVAFVLTEGTDWTAATSDEATATSLASAINALAGVTAASGGTDTITVGEDTAIVGRVRLDGAAR